MVSGRQSWGSNTGSLMPVLMPEDTAYLPPCTARHTAGAQIHTDLMLFLDGPMQRMHFLPMAVKTRCV